MHFYSRLPVSEQPDASRYPRCYRWFRSAGGCTVHRYRVPDADSVLVPTSFPVCEQVTSLQCSPCHCSLCGCCFQGHPVSPDTIVDVVSSAMLIERTLSLPADVDIVSDGHRI